MENYKIKVYRDAKELYSYIEHANIDFFSFAFKDTADILAYDSNVGIDITSLLYYLKVNTHDCLPAERNFIDLSADTHILVHESAKDLALEIFPCLFSDYEYMTENTETVSSDMLQSPLHTVHYQAIYTYDNDIILSEFVNYCSEQNIPIASFPYAMDIIKNNYDKFNKEQAVVIIDITSLSYAIEDNKNILYLSEQFIMNYPNAKFIIKTSQADVIFKFYPLYFNQQLSVDTLFENFSISTETNMESTHSLARITDFSPSDLSSLIDKFNHNLIGHSNFKEHFANSIRNFILLNQAKEQKVFSIFLFGKSGIGKTEVARILNECLSKDSLNKYIAKINFQNYSSQDALNSLIGSPSGYIGCEHGELSEKVKKSSVGLILCDEFDKTNRPVFSYFLELLEEGKFTDSMAREYDLDGYIIIFTSNLLTKKEYESKIPPELQTRFDLVCEFEEPTTKEKEEFLELLLEKAKIKFSDQFANINFTSYDKRKLFDFDFSSIHALRDIKRQFNNRLMDYFVDKKVL